MDNKITHCAENIAKYYEKYDEYKGTQFVFSDLGTYKPDQWTPCGELKRKLVDDYGIPEDEITFIQEAKTEKQRKQLIKAMNEGKVRVLIGSTETLGTGVNAQERCVAIHHLDCPWRPSDLEQRDGRGVRAGNWVAKLHANNRVDVIIMLSNVHWTATNSTFFIISRYLSVKLRIIPVAAVLLTKEVWMIKVI